MKELWMDPVVLGACGVIFFGFILLLWAVRKLNRLSPSKPKDDLDFPFKTGSEPLMVVAPDNNPFLPRAAPAPAPAPAVAVANKDVLDKVEIISQRLVDMQMLLNKQLSAPSVVAQGGGGALGISPEILEKLIKITGNVAQQVEILQKTMAGSPAAASPNEPVPAVATAPPPMAAAPRPAAGPVPVSQVIGGAGKSGPAA